MSNHKRTSEFGGGIIYVFVGLILFATLAYVFSKGFHGSTSKTSGMTGQTKAAEVMSYGDTLTKAVNKLLLSGCSINQINFKTDRYTKAAVSVNPNAPLDGRCDVFAPGKGGVRWMNCPDPNICSDPYLYDPHFPDSMLIVGVGSRPEDLVMTVLVSPETCDTINRRLGLPVDDIAETSLDGDYYVGTFTHDNQIPLTTTTNYQAYEKRTAGCVRVRNYITMWGGDYRAYFHVLSAL